MFLLSIFKYSTSQGLCHSSYMCWRNLIFSTSFPQARIIYVFVDILLHLCGYYLFCVTIISEKFSDTQWKFQPTSVFLYLIEQTFSLPSDCVMFYEQNKYFVILWFYLWKLQSTVRRGIKLCFVGLSYMWQWFHVYNLIKACWMSSKYCLCSSWMWPVSIKARAQEAHYKFIICPIDFYMKSQLKPIYSLLLIGKNLIIVLQEHFKLKFPVYSSSSWDLKNEDSTVPQVAYKLITCYKATFEK